MEQQTMTIDEQLAGLNVYIQKITGGTFSVQPIVPTSLYPTLSETLWHYYGMPAGFQRLHQRTKSIQGRMGWFVCQLSHGTQQIKLYEPWKYKNNVNTPLRIRARRIVQMASQEPPELRKDKMRELYRTYPYHLLKSEAINLKLKNFYFDGKVIEGDELKIYKAANPQNPDPENDTLVVSVFYKKSRTQSFQFDKTEEEHFYAVNSRNGAMSNLLHFIWQEEIEFEVKEGKPLKKWVMAAELVNGEDSLFSSGSGKVVFKNSKYLEMMTGKEVEEVGTLAGKEDETMIEKKDEEVRRDAESTRKLSYSEKRKLKMRRRKGNFYKEVQKMQEKYEILKFAGFFGEGSR